MEAPTLIGVMVPQNEPELRPKAMLDVSPELRGQLAASVHAMSKVTEYEPVSEHAGLPAV